MAGAGPDQGDRHRHEQYTQPDRDVILHSAAEHQPTERNEHQAVGEQMPETGMAEGSGEHAPQR